MATHKAQTHHKKAKKKSKAHAAKKATKAGSQKPVVTQPCPLAKDYTPCDIVDLALIADIASSPDHVTNAKVKKEDTRILSRFGTQGVTDEENRMEVVTYRQSDHNKTKITAEVKNFASRDAIHPMLRLNQAGQAPRQWIGGATAKVETEVFTAPFKSTLLGLAFSTLWNFQIKPVRYVYSVTTCGVRRNGKVVGGTDLTVDAYPGDQYEIEYSSGAHSEHEWKKKEGWSKKEDGSEPEISVKRNNSALMEGKSLQELLDSLSKLKMILRGLEELIKDAPKTGVQYEVSVDFWEGSMSLTWGWKQDEGLRVYYGVTGEVALTIISVDLSLGFGIDWKLLVVKVEIAIDKGEVKLVEQIHLKFLAETPFEERIEVKVEIEAVCRALASAGYGWCSYKAELGVKSGIEGEAGISIEPDASHWFCKIDWTGVKGYLMTGTPSRADSEEAHQFVQERELLDWKSK